MPTKQSKPRRNARPARSAPRMDEDQLENLLLQALETEMGGVEVYDMAIRCADNEDLRKEWQKYRAETREHERILLDVFDRLDWDPDRQTAERDIVHHIGRSLVQAMEQALDDGEPGSAELVATECVTFAETKDHLNWQLIGECAKAATGRTREILMEAYEKVEDQEDEHLYHTMGWCRELWLQSLRLPAVIPPPEERKDVKSAIGAARAKKQRKRQAKMTKPTRKANARPKPEGARKPARRVVASDEIGENPVETPTASPT